MNYTNVKYQYDQIAEAKGNDKHPLILAALKTPDFVRVTQYILNPSKKFNVAKLKSIGTETESQDLFEFLDYLNSKSGATKKDKQILLAIASESKDKFFIVNKILRKKTDAGFTNNTMNKLAPGLIPYYPYCRCKGMSHAKNIKFPCYSQLKADGLYHEPIDGVYRTRNGKVMDLILVPQEHKVDSTGAKFMGEALLLKEGSETEFEKRKDGNAIINKSQHSGLSQGEADRVRFVYWDIDRGQAKDLGYRDRLDMLKDSGANTIECRIVNDWNEAFEHYDEVRELDLEGTILKNFDGKWIDGNSPDQIKAKAVKECELLVTGTTEGEDKYVGMVGALVCESSCGGLVTKIGMGLSDEDRAREDWEGQFITVRFNEVSKSKNKDTYALSHARLVDKREDKFEADTLDYILKVKEVKR